MSMSQSLHSSFKESSRLTTSADSVMQRTLAIVMPDTMAAGLLESVLVQAEEAGFRIVSGRDMVFTEEVSSRMSETFCGR